MKNIEVEMRSFITPEQHGELLEFFKNKATFLNEDEQITYYFDAPHDLRIQKNNFYSKMWLKKGKIHDEQREEIEIKFAREDFDTLEQLFLTIGFPVKIKWLRKRSTFQWEGISVMLDWTKGYGYIIELEKMAEENEKEEVLLLLQQKLHSLQIPLTPREVFDTKFQHYQENWRQLIEEKEES